MVLDARRISPTTATNALTIKDTPERIAAAARVHLGHRQGAAGSHHRRRAARGRSHEAAGVRPADRRRPDSPGHQRHRSTIAPAPTEPTITLQALRQPDAVRHPARRTCRRSTTGCSRPTPTRGRWPTRSCERPKACRRRRGSASSVPVPVDDVRADRHRRHAAAADHVVQLPEHRREHRHHAAHAPRRRRVAGAEDRGDEHLGHRLRRAADVRQPRDQHGHPAARRRDEHAGGSDSRRRAPRRWTGFPG